MNEKVVDDDHPPMLKLFDNGDVVTEVIGLWQLGMEVVERFSDGFVIMWQVGDYSMFKEVMEGGYLVGYESDGLIDDYEEDLINCPH